MPALIVGWCIVKDNVMFLVHFDIEEKPLFFGTFLVLIRSWEKPKDYQNNTIWSTHDFTRNLHIDNEKSDILYAPNETAIDNIRLFFFVTSSSSKVVAGTVSLKP
jgi:hypothetical protein